MRMEVCTKLLRRWRIEDLENKIIFSDEAVFHVCGRVNRHNSRTWVSERPTDFIEWQAYTPKVNVWIGMTNRKIYDPYFFTENTINAAAYHRMLSEFLIPELINDIVIFQ